MLRFCAALQEDPVASLENNPGLATVVKFYKERLRAHKVTCVLHETLPNSRSDTCLSICESLFAVS